MLTDDMAHEGRVVVITTGGTIASKFNAAQGAWAPSVGAEAELLEVLGPEFAARVQLKPYMNVLGPALTPEDLFAIARCATAELVRTEVVGVVVTSGTGVIEEGSFLCELLNTTTKPIVWTGAQRGADAADCDGPRNLRSAIMVALSNGAPACGAGALVCFNEEVFAARDAVKMHKTSTATFTAFDAGVLARIDDRGVLWLRRLVKRHAFEVDHLVTAVDLISLAVGTDDRFFQASIASGVHGIVVEGFPGTGMVSRGARRGIEAALAAGICVVLSARSPIGRILPRYGTELGAASLTRLGVILGGDLPAVKLRMLLMVLLAKERDPMRLQALFQEVLP